MNTPERELVLCIPGLWKDRGEFVQAIVAESRASLYLPE